MIEEDILKTITKYNMLRRGDKVVLAVSGGPDSVALLLLLQELSPRLGISIHAAHLNHMLRGEESEGDANFVKGLCDARHIAVTQAKRDVKAVATERSLSLEEAARECRYEFFVEVAREVKAGKIAIAHTLDDQAETVLMRLLRGAGLTGLAGIPPVRVSGSTSLRVHESSSLRVGPADPRGTQPVAGSRRLADSPTLYIIRPLIETWRCDVERYLAQEGITARIDSSNLARDFLRNRIRNELLPSLERDYNQNIKVILANLAEQAREDADFLRSAGARKFRTSCKVDKRGQVHINLKKFRSYHRAIQKQVFRTAIKMRQGSLRRVTYQHFKELDMLIFQRPSGSIVDLPDGIKFKKERENLVVL